MIETIATILAVLVTIAGTIIIGVWGYRDWYSKSCRDDDDSSFDKFMTALMMGGLGFSVAICAGGLIWGLGAFIQYKVDQHHQKHHRAPVVQSFQD